MLKFDDDEIMKTVINSNNNNNNNNNKAYLHTYQRLCLTKLRLLDTITRNNQDLINDVINK
jgi:hypothetical protein